MIDDLSVGRNSIMWQSKIRSNICTTLIKTPQNLTLDDFLHDYAPDGEFGDCFDVISLIYTNQNPHFVVLEGARESRINMTMLPLWGEYYPYPHHQHRRRLPRKKRNINKIIKKRRLGVLET